jgi:hypothetical protein
LQILGRGRIREGERRIDEKGSGWSAKEENHPVAQASLSSPLITFHH